MVPLLSPIWLSTCAATFSSSSSNWSPVFACVPPERSTSPVNSRHSALVGGIEKIAGPDQRAAGYQRQFMILQQEHLDAVG